MSYVLRYNDSHIHSIPVGITTLSNTMYKQINARAGNNIPDSQPIKTYSKMFQSLKPRLKFDGRTFISIFFIGFGVLIILSGFPVDIVRDRQVRSCCCLKSDLWCRCFHWKDFFWSLLECPMFFDNTVKLMQIRKYLECELFQCSSTLHGSWMKKHASKREWKVLQNVREPFSECH